jgi:hypothetical protein
MQAQAWGGASQMGVAFLDLGPSGRVGVNTGERS